MKKLLSIAAMAFIAFAAPAAHAVDGCQVLLCLAGNWRNISVCVPPVTAAMRHAALGGGWPTCNMSSGASAGSSSIGSTPTTQDTCPPMYQQFQTDEQFQHYVGCTYTGVVSVSIGGQLWSTMYWNANGDSVTDYSGAAKAQLGAGNYDTTFDQQLAAWVADHPTNPDQGCTPRPDAPCPELR